MVVAELTKWGLTAQTIPAVHAGTARAKTTSLRCALIRFIISLPCGTLLILRHDGRRQGRCHARGDTILCRRSGLIPPGALGGGARGAEPRSPHEVSSAPLPAMHRYHPGWRRGHAAAATERLTPFTRTRSEESRRTSSEGTRRGGEPAVAMGARSRVMTQTPAMIARCRDIEAAVQQGPRTACAPAPDRVAFGWDLPTFSPDTRIVVKSY